MSKNDDPDKYFYSGYGIGFDYGLWIMDTGMVLNMVYGIWCLLQARSSLTFKQHEECRFTLKLVRDMIIAHNPSACDCECNKACKFGEYSDIKNCSYEKRLFGKLVLACEDEVH